MSEQVGHLHALVTADVDRARANLSRFRDSLEQAGGGATKMGTVVDRSTVAAGRSLDALASKAKNTGGIWNEFVTGAKGQMMELATLAGIGIIADGAIDLTKQGDSIRRANAQLLAYAGTAEKAAQYTLLVQGATDGAATKFEATGAAAVLLKNRIATNTAEMDKFARAANVLGQTTGLSVEGYAKELAAAFANSSWDRLDQLGIVSMNVRERVEELKKSGMGMQDAFRTAVIEDMARQADLLTQAGAGGATVLERMSAAARDFRDGAALPLSTAVNDLSTDFGDFFAALSGGQSVNFSQLGEDLMKFALQSSDIEQNIKVTQAWTKVAQDAQAQNTLLTASLEQRTIATNILTVAEARAAGTLQSIPLEDTAAQSRAVAEAFLEVGREAGLSQSEIIRLWVATGGSASEMGIAGNKAYAYATSLNAVGTAAYNAARNVMLFKDAQGQAQALQMGLHQTGVNNVLPMDALSFRERRELRQNSQMTGSSSGGSQFTPTTPQQVSNANWWMQNASWDAATAVGGSGRGGRSGLSEAEKQAQEWQRIWQSATGNIRDAVTGAFDMSITVTRNQDLMSKVGLYTPQPNEAGRQLEDIINRGKDSPHAKTFFQDYLGLDDATLKGQAAALQDKIAAFLSPEHLNMDAILQKARDTLIGNRNREAMADQLTQVLIGEGFGMSEVQSELAKQLGITIPVMSDDIAVQLADGFYASVQAQQFQFAQAGDLIKKALADGTNGAGQEVVAILLAEVMDALAERIEAL